MNLDKWPTDDIRPIPLSVDFGYSEQLLKRQRALYEAMRENRTHTYDGPRYFKGG